MKLMQFKRMFACMVALLLALKARSQLFSLSKVKVDNCNQDRYVKIKCTSSKIQCEARCDGQTSSNAETRFKLIAEDFTEKTIPRRNLSITFTQKGGIKYVLKVNRTKPVKLIFQNQPRNTADDSDSLFVETRVGTKFFTYEHTIDNVVMCLTSRCDGSLSLIRPSSNLDRACYFERRVHN